MNISIHSDVDIISDQLREYFIHTRIKAKSTAILDIGYRSGMLCTVGGPPQTISKQV